MNVVITQSMYFPWVGLLEQIRLADIVVHYDDVQFSKGSFTNRVQIKTPTGTCWMTIPLKNLHRGQHIDQVMTNDSTNWRAKHRKTLQQAYAAAPYCNDILNLVDEVFELPAAGLAELSRNSMTVLAKFFNLCENKHFIHSTELNIDGRSSRRILDIVKALGGSTYITGHGAKNYLEHALFEQAGIEVRYMHYQCNPYPQLHGKFTPYVSGLDLVANCGASGIDVIRSETINWRDFINESA